MLRIVLSAGPAVQYLILVGNWAHAFYIYRQRIMRMRRGDYFFNRKLYREEGANKFVGYQVAGMTLSSFFFMGAGLTLVLSVTTVVIVLITTQGGAEYVKSIMDALPGFIFGISSIFATLIVQLSLNRFVFFVGPRGNKWIRYRFWCVRS